MNYISYVSMNGKESWGIFALKGYEQIASFDREDQLEKFADKLGFRIIRCDTGKYSSIPIFDNFKDDMLDNSDISQAYSISKESLKQAEWFVSVKNGRISKAFFVNNGTCIKIYRCSPEDTRFWRPSTFYERLNLREKYGKL